MPNLGVVVAHGLLEHRVRFLVPNAHVDARERPGFGVVLAFELLPCQQPRDAIRARSRRARMDRIGPSLH